MPTTHYNAALKSFESGQLAQAEDFCGKALAVDRGHAGSLHLLGAIHAATGRLGRAVELMAQSVRSDPSNPEYFSNLGTLLQRQGRFDDAFKCYDLALRFKPDSVA